MDIRFLSMFLFSAVLVGSFSISFFSISFQGLTSKHHRILFDSTKWNTVATVSISSSLISNTTLQFAINFYCKFGIHPTRDLYWLAVHMRRSKSQHNIQHFLFSYYFWCSLLLLSGDVEQNPGPRVPKYPCGTCHKAVKAKDPAVCCDQCNKWVHNKCSGLSADAYACLQNSDCIWICPNCGIPNFSNSFFDSETSSLDSSVESNNRFSPLANRDPYEDQNTFNIPNRSNLRSTSRSNHENSKKPLRFASVNINSLKSKSLEMTHLINDKQIDIFCFQETKLDSDIYSSEIFDDSFTLFRKDRNIHGGGVGIAVRSSAISASICDEINSESESIWIKIHNCSTGPVYFCSFYRPPGKPLDYIQFLRHDLEKIRSKHNRKPARIIIAGDFNYPSINWDTNSAPCQSEGDSLLDILRDFHLEQMVREPTYFRSTLPHVLDLLITSHPEMITDIQVNEEISDHCYISSNLWWKLTHTIRKKQIKLYNKGNYDQIKKDLTNFKEDYLKSASSCSVDENWTKIKMAIIDTVNKNIPTKTVTNNKKRNYPWIDRVVRRNIKMRNKLAAKMKADPSEENRNKYKKQRNKTTNILRNSYKHHTEKIIGNLKQNPKNFYKFINSKKVVNSTIPPLNISNYVTETVKEQAKCLNQQFSSVFSREQTDYIPYIPCDYNRMPDIEVEETGVKKLLNNIDISKSCGPDGIPSRILKDCSEIISPIYTSLFNQSLKSACLPLDWRTANIFPLHKKGSKALPANYRPISLTSITCKLLEHIVASSIHRHLNLCSILTPLQHGFRANHSCETQLILAVNDWSHSLDKNIHTDAIIFDFSKAFDVVPHQRLLSKLNSYGIGNGTLNWIGSFLCNRQQRVVIDGTASEWTPVLSGVPQGTVLGPLLFILYINDIIQGVNSNIRLFADDCILYREIHSIEDQIILQNDINTLHNWATKWHMKFNSSKCYVLPISRRRKHTFLNSYMLGSEQLQTVINHQYLGVTISQDLRWNNHIQGIVSKATKNLNFIRRNIYMCSSESKALAYTSLVRPILEYASSAWDPYTIKNINLLESVQKRAARFVKHTYSQYSSASKIVQDLGWETLECRRRIARLSNFYKAFHLISPISLSHLNHPSRGLRYAFDTSFKTLQTSTDVYKYSFIPRTINDWNALPPSLHRAPSMNSFRDSLYKLSWDSKADLGLGD